MYGSRKRLRYKVKRTRLALQIPTASHASVVPAVCTWGPGGSWLAGQIPLVAVVVVVDEQVAKDEKPVGADGTDARMLLLNASCYGTCACLANRAAARLCWGAKAGPSGARGSRTSIWIT